MKEAGRGGGGALGEVREVRSLGRAKTSASGPRVCVRTVQATGDTNACFTMKTEGRNPRRFGRGRPCVQSRKSTDGAAWCSTRNTSH